MGVCMYVCVRERDRGRVRRKGKRHICVWVGGRERMREIFVILWQACGNMKLPGTG